MRVACISCMGRGGDRRGGDRRGGDGRGGEGREAKIKLEISN